MSRGQRRYRQRVIDGVCTGCGKVPPRLPSKQCQDCLDKQKARDPLAARTRKKLLRERRKAGGLCVFCGSIAVVGKIDCARCHALALNSSKKSKDKCRSLSLCTRCGKDVTYQKYRICQECRRKELARRRLAYLEQGLCKTCGKNPIRTPETTLCQLCVDRLKSNHKMRKSRLRREIVDHYGACCACCGETQYEFLTIDHVNNDGAVHKRVVGRDTYSVLRWIKANDFPNSIQILCYNCNCVRNTYGYCPHQKQDHLT